MKQVVNVCVIILFVGVSTLAGVIPTQPIETIYWSQFMSLFAIGEKVLAIGPRGVVSFDWSDVTQPMREENHFRFDMNPTRSKLFGDQLWAYDSITNQLHMFSLGADLTVSRHRSVHLPDSTADFARYGDDIIVSRRYQGLWRYRLADEGEPQLVDTSYKGVHMTSLCTDGDNLYALDTYNGIMRFDLRGDTFGSFSAYLYSEYEGTTFATFQEQFFLTGLTGGIIEGAFGNAGSGVVNVISTQSIPKRVQASDERLIVQRERSIGWIDRSNPSIRQERVVDNGMLDGALYFNENNDTWFLYPNLSGGISRFSTVPGIPPSEIIERPGPITGFAFSHGMLVTGGRRSPIDVLQVDSLGNVSRKFSLTEGHPATGPLVTFGDTILAIYPEDAALARVEVDFARGTGIVAASINVDTLDLLDLRYVCNVRGDHELAIVRYPRRLDVYELLQSGFANKKTWRTTGGIEAYEVSDSIVVFASDKNAIYVHAIDSNLEQGQLLHTIETGGADVIGMEFCTPFLRVFGTGSIEVYDISSLISHAHVGFVLSPRSIADFQRFDKYLFTVGHDGIQVFDASDSIPVLVDQGGGSGNMIAIDRNNLAISDGHAIDMYLLSLFDQGTPPDDTGSPPPPHPPNLPTTFAMSQNYPNPFNGTTYIEYDIPHTSQVAIELYNVLGQNIRTLVSTTREPGRYRLMWDGRNDNGAEVASGIYFYRFEAGENRIVKKMLYVK